MESLRALSQETGGYINSGRVMLWMVRDVVTRNSQHKMGGKRLKLKGYVFQ